MAAKPKQAPDDVPAALIGEPVGILPIGMTAYRIYKLQEDHEDQSLTVKYGYRLLGPKSQSFYLMRNLNDLSLMFALDKTGVPAAEFKEVWFTDKTGALCLAV